MTASLTINRTSAKSRAGPDILNGRAMLCVPRTALQRAQLLDGTARSLSL